MPPTHPALDRLTTPERGQLLGGLVAAHPALRAYAYEQLSEALRRLGIELGIAAATVESVESADGPGLALSVRVDVQHEGDDGDE